MFGFPGSGGIRREDPLSHPWRLGHGIPAIHTPARSLEVKKPRPDIERLFTGARVLILARTYALAQGCQDPAAYLAAQWPRATEEFLFLPWGAAGAYGHARQGLLHFAPAQVPDAVVDTRGVRDIFNAALIDGLLMVLGLEALLAHPTALAGHKSGRQELKG